MRYQGRVAGFKFKTEWNSDFILLKDVYNEQHKLFREHVWVKRGKRLSDLQLHDLIEFTAVEEPYMSSNGEKLKLEHIRNVEFVRSMKEDISIQQKLKRRKTK